MDRNLRAAAEGTIKKKNEGVTTKTSRTRNDIKQKYCEVMKLHFKWNVRIYERIKIDTTYATLSDKMLF